VSFDVFAWEAVVSFVRNSWYMGAWARELREKPVGRLILGEPVVMFRTASGAFGAMRDVCPHRAVPLSLGRTTTWEDLEHVPRKLGAAQAGSSGREP
jgi:phenylpropionate dioxygenase-like ring-hydroxylating dioxygenase large terminal subunit